MTIPHALVVLSCVLMLAGGYRYVSDVLAGGTKPNRITWLMCAAAPLIATAAALHAHASVWPTARTFFAGLIPVAVLAASLANPRSYWRITAFDMVCGGISAVGLLLWLAAQSPNAAIIFAALADVFAIIPTIKKSWLHPKTETGAMYVAGLVSALLVLPSVPRWNIANAAFQISLIAVNTALIAAVYGRRAARLLARTGKK